MSKKSLITAVSTAAMVATIGFAYAQSSDEGAVPNANINGAVDNNVPKHWARDSVIDDPYDTAAPTAAGPAETMPADTMSSADATTSSTATPPAADATSPWAADSSSTSAPAPAPSSYDSTVNSTDPVNQTNSSMSTNTAPSETHIDLNSPNDPIYNLGKDYDERAPRPDRN